MASHTVRVIPAMHTIGEETTTRTTEPQGYDLEFRRSGVLVDKRPYTYHDEALMLVRIVDWVRRGFLDGVTKKPSGSERLGLNNKQEVG